MSGAYRQSTAWWLCRKLSMRPTDGRGLPPGVITAVAGVALSVAIMLLSVSVVYGFKYNIIKQLTGFHAQITVSAPEHHDSGTTDGLQNTPKLQSALTSILRSSTLPGTDPSITLVLTEPTVLKTDSAFQGILLKGLEANENAWNFVQQNLVSGRVPTASDTTANTMVISSVTASALNVDTGDHIMAHFIDEESLRSRKMLITGIYDSHFHDYDATTAFTPIAMLQKLNHIDSITGTSLEIRGLEPELVETVARSLITALYQPTMDVDYGNMLFNVSTLRDKCALYINWLDLLDTNVVVIIILMSCVAAFTLISSLFIIILQRVPTIGLLKALGATDTLIRRTFIYMTMKLVGYGLIIGNTLALAIIAVQDYFHLLPLDPESYYLNYIPVRLSITTCVIINISAITISALILILPSHIIAKISPAKSIRYE